MTPELMLLVGNILLKYGPVIAQEVVLLFQKQDPTPQDWKKIFDMAKESWKDYNPNPQVP